MAHPGTRATASAVVSAATPMAALYREWDVAQAAVLALEDDYQWGIHPASRALTAIDERVAVEPITSLADLALWLAMMTWHGDQTLSRESVAKMLAFLGKGA